MKFVNLSQIFILFCIISSSIFAQDARKWCWTKNMANEASFQLNPNLGGINWGYCKSAEVAGPTTYLAQVETSTVKFAETVSTVKIKLYGDKGESQMLVLSDNGFERGSVRNIALKSNDVGNVQKIIVYVLGVQNYQCKRVTILSGPKKYNFECIKMIQPCGPGQTNLETCSEEIMVDGTIPFELSVKTSDEDGFGTTAPVLINVIGTKGYSQTRLMGNRGFPTASTRTRVAYLNDIGEVTGFKLVLSDHGKWKPVFVSINNLVTKSAKNFNLDNVVLTNPGKETYILDSSKKKEELSEDKDDNKENTLDINNPDGGLIEFAEKKQIIHLKCNQALINPTPDNQIFGPDFPTKFVNYMNILAKCPQDCHKGKTKVFGVGIHPMESPICASAMIDKAASYFGGIISISIFPGLDKYSVPVNYNPLTGQISVISFGTSKKSFTVAKVDNIDLVEKDIRILNGKGLLSNKGRVELRKEGVWGTICSIGNNRLSARRICMDLGYKDGEWLSPNTPDEAKDFCKSYDSSDHCGAEIQPVQFWKIECEDSDTHLNQCRKKFADQNECSHSFDAIINCYNVNYQKDPEVPQGIVRLEQTDKIGGKTVGRLEVYKGKSFLPVCYLKFTKVSADVACRQMGFEEGDVAPDDFSERFRLPATSTVGFAASDVECKGGENAFDECKRTTSKILCKHSQDVVLICSRGNGDPTGKSQYNKPPISAPPALSKLGMKKYTLTCDDRGNSHYFRGEAGSIYLVSCPKDCGRRKGSIWGTGLYTSNSHICKAAVHAGIIEDENGGTFAIIKTWGNRIYYANELNGVRSYEHTKNWPVSFFMSKVNSGWVNMEKLHRGQLGSFIELSSNVINKKVSESTSFIEMSNSNTNQNRNEMYIPKPVFQWIPNNVDFSFSDSTNIIDDSNKVGQLNKFSFIAQFTMKDFKSKKQYLFSFENCRGLNVVIDETGNLLIGDLCNDNRWIKTNIMVPLNDKIVLFFTYNKGTLNLIYRSNILKYPIGKVFTTNMEVSGVGPISVGRLSTERKDFFYGKIDFIQLYDTEIDPKIIEAIINSLELKKAPKINEKTLDNRDCVKSCTDNPLPGTPGAPEPPADTNPSSSVEIPNISKNSNSNNNQITVGTSTKGNDSNTDSKGGVQINYGTYDKKEEANIESIEIGCETDLRDTRFNGSPGKIFRVKCKNCQAEKSPVFGSYIFHPISSICKAALHVGVLSTKNPAGDIIVEIHKGKSMFNGSMGQSGITSGTIGSSAVSFKVRKAKPLTKVACSTSVNQEIFAQAAVGAKFVVLCPSKCSSLKKPIYGTEIYTDNSPICLSAIHFGALTDKGGEIEFIIESGLSDYKGSRGFGIESKAKGPHIRSYRFLGSKSGVFYRFTENYDGKLKNKWSINKHKEIRDGAKDSWKYLIAQTKTAAGLVENIKAIEHRGAAYVIGDLRYSSWLSLNNVEFANGIIKFNFKLLNDNPIAILFRYTNEDNYYGIDFNMKSSMGTIKLIRRVEGQTSIIDSKGIKIVQDKWYRWQIILEFDHVKLFLQEDKIRQNRLIFSKEVLGLSRGTIGISNNGNSNFLVNGIDIDEYNENKKKKFENNNRSWSKLIAKLDEKDRKLYCRDSFDNEEKEVSRCMEIHNFCKIRCDELIPPEENIINFSCFKDCVRTANSKDSKGDGNAIQAIGKADWIPNVGEKCDFRPTGSNSYLMCVVKKVKKVNKTYKVIVSYSDDDMKLTTEVQYPSNDLSPCGKNLSMRTDCIKVRKASKKPKIK